MADDKNKRHLRNNGVALALSIINMGAAVGAFATGNDPIEVWHAIVIITDALLASWFTCGIVNGLRNRRCPID